MPTPGFHAGRRFEGRVEKCNWSYNQFHYVVVLSCELRILYFGLGVATGAMGGHFAGAPPDQVLENIGISPMCRGWLQDIVRRRQIDMTAPDQAAIASSDDLLHF
jgi:hypothetical protein